jgi:AraC-like DNA-binding protein
MSISSTVLSGAEIRFHPPEPTLRPHVGCFWVITAQPGAIMRLVPDGTTSIAFERDGSGALVGYFRGPLLAPVQKSFSDSTTLIGVRLRPGVAFNLTRIPMHTLSGRRIPLAQADALSALASISEAEQSPEELIATLQNALIERLASTKIHRIVEHVLAEIHATRGDISISELAGRCDTSERHLGRLMREWVGYGTKRYCAIVRFQSSLAGMERVPQARVASLATESGYFDQSHMSADVSRFSGDTPGQLVEERVSDFSKTQCDVPF